MNLYNFEDGETISKWPEIKLINFKVKFIKPNLFELCLKFAVINDIDEVINKYTDENNFDMVCLLSKFRNEKYKIKNKYQLDKKLFNKKIINLIIYYKKYKLLN